MLTWISENAKWVIYIFIVGIVAGLLFMDMSSMQLDKRPPVGKVNGEALSNDLFDIRLKQIQQRGAGVSEEQSARIREELFRSFVQQNLLNTAIKKAKITASVYEMKHDLWTDPPQGIDREPLFQTNGAFDFEKYEQWLSDPATYDMPFMRDYENMLKIAKIPEKQLRVFVGANVHPTTLEAQFNVLNRESKYAIWTALVNPRAMKIDTVVSDAAIDSVYNALPDSFFVEEPVARVNYVALPIEPSSDDEINVLNYVNMFIEQIKEGSDFEEIARANSEDLGSAENGGDLGDYTARGTWVPEFDSVAFNLEAGEISNAVRSRYGYHIINVLDKRIVEGEEQVKARHILVNVSASKETSDSLEAILNSVKIEVDKGKKFEDIASTNGLTVQSSNWFKRGEEVFELGFVPGLYSYAFYNPLSPKNDGISSEVLLNHNKKWVVLFVKTNELEAGIRSQDYYREKIIQKIINDRYSQAAANYLKSQIYALREISVLDSSSQNSIENISIDSFSVAREGYLHGLGFASPELYHALTYAKEGEWSGPYTGAQGVVMIKLIDKTTPKEETLTSTIKDELQSSWQYGSFGIFSDYMRNLEESAKIINNLDLYYRE